MFHSTYVATRLGIWREKGRMKLQSLFAKMGFSLVQARTPYLYMDIELRRDLIRKLSEHVGAFGLIDLTYPSFRRCFGFKCVLSAADVVHSLMALMECDDSLARHLQLQWSWKVASAARKNGGFFRAFDALQKFNYFVA